MSNNFTDLVEGDTKGGFWFNSWMCDDCVHFTFGLVSLTIPISEWQEFSEMILQTTLKKKAIDELVRASNKKSGKGKKNEK